MTPNIAGNLANFLPTGTYLAFQSLAPLFTNNGHCGIVEKIMTGLLILVFVIICWVLSFTDSVTTDSGKIYYGVVTRKGLWNPQFAASRLPGVDGSFYIGVTDTTKYKVNTADFINAALVVITFCALSLLTSPITSCYYGELSGTIVKCAPILVALIVGVYFSFAPPPRNGVGFAVITGNIELVKELEDPMAPFQTPRGTKDAGTKSASVTKGEVKDRSSNSSPLSQHTPSPRLSRPPSKASV